MINLFKSNMDSTNIENLQESSVESSPNLNEDNHTPLETDITIDGENDLMASLNTFDKPFDQIKNKSIKKCLSILADKIDELSDINNFLSRNNNIMLRRISSLEKALTMT